MTTKETLHELIDNLSDEEAAELLARVSQKSERADREGATLPTRQSFWDFLDDVAATIPEAELKRLAPSDQIDEVVYRRHGR